MSKASKKSAKKTEAVENVPLSKLTRDFEEWVEEQAKKLGVSEQKIIEETNFIAVAETGELLKIDASQQLFKTGTQEPEELAECRRLRDKFGPVSACVDWIKDQIIGGGIDIFIDDAKDKYKTSLKEELKKMMLNISQDVYTTGLDTLIDILVDDAITVGFAAAEIVYGKTVTFNDYAKPIDVLPSIQEKEKTKLATSSATTITPSMRYEISEPEWKELEGVTRLKIITNAINRLKLYRDAAWEALYWVLDEVTTTGTNEFSEKEIIRKSLRKKAEAQSTTKFSAMLLPWQLFVISLNRKRYDEKGSSMILPVLRQALLLEKILNAVGEGIYRAGNKKYFIVCGTEARQWGLPHIRNLLQLLKEASEKNWSTIPVNAGFDIKEAGGEVFEATNVVNYFMRVIADGMHVPPDVLGLAVRGRTTSNLSYQRFRSSLQNAIQLQLFKLHIWCKFSKERQKQGGNTEAHYLPEVRIKTEGLLAEADRLKMCVQLLNVANPIRPEVKLEAEREITKIMGWDKVLLPTQEEYKDELEELEKELKKEKEAKLAKKPLLAGEKAQGEQRPQDEEMLRKRQEAGPNVRKVGSKKGGTRPMGETRIPAEVRKPIEETAIEEKKEPQKVEITVKTENKPQEITIKHEPQELKVTHEPQQIKIVTETPLDNLMKELAEKEKALTVKREELETEESKQRQSKLKAEITKTEKEIEKIETQIQEIKKSEEAKRVEEKKTEETKREEEKKTQERKRNILYEAQKKLKELESEGD